MDPDCPRTWLGQDFTMFLLDLHVLVLDEDFPCFMANGVERTIE